jgi:crotonobetainyl-CoA:carnitine CoA-transferase CaiB-like acyl-CoA transferase
MLVRPDDDLGELLQHNVLFRMSQTRRRHPFHRPAHGADTDEVLRAAGYDEDRIAELRGRGVVR